MSRTRRNRAVPHSETSSSKPRRRCNELDGRRWLKNSISVWDDIRKSPEESRSKHPAMFPQMLVERLIETFLPPPSDQQRRRVVLDPFAGSGSTIVVAERMGLRGVGLEISPEFVALANQRLAEVRASAGNAQRAAPKGALPSEDSASRQTNTETVSEVHCASAADVCAYAEPESVDLCITSPPYWNILNQRRTADGKAVRHYGNLQGDLGTIQDYEEFLSATTAVFSDVLTALVPGGYCLVVVMDLRKKNRFFPLHSDLAGRMAEAGYVFDDLIVWNRQAEYNNLRPLGFPSVFRVNKVHEFILLMQKPRDRCIAR